MKSIKLILKNGKKIELEPILTLNFKGYISTVGKNTEGNWIVHKKWDNLVESAFELSDKNDLYHFLHLLDLQEKYKHDEIRRVLEKRNLDGNAFPVMDLIKFGLNSGGNWMIRAFEWVEKKDIDADESLRIILLTKMKDKELSQNFRHKIMKKLNRK